jgi:hypothetical protein
MKLQKQSVMIARRLLSIVNARATHAMKNEDVEPFGQAKVCMLTSPVVGDLISLRSDLTCLHLLPVRMSIRPSIEAVIYDLRESSILTLDDIIEFHILEESIVHVGFHVPEHSVWSIQ